MPATTAGRGGPREGRENPSAQAQDGRNGAGENESPVFSGPAGGASRCPIHEVAIKERAA